jgi:Tfp pilus assembly protein PilP
MPLDALRLIGNLRRGREAIALIQADKLIYSVRVGAHLGLDLGKVTAIHDKAVDIEEWVADSTGQWIRRQTQLVLQEKK